jgi:hypothetical protein
MYDQIKDLRKAIERKHALATANADEALGERNYYSHRGQMNAFYEVLGLIDAALDEYDNADQPTPAEIATSDFADYVAFMAQCRP